MTWRAAFDQAFAVQQPRGFAGLGIKEQPVADRGLERMGDGVLQVVAGDAQGVAMDLDDADGGRFGQLLDAELGGEERLPAECVDGRTGGRGHSAAGQKGGIVLCHLAAVIWRALSCGLPHIYSKKGAHQWRTPSFRENS